VPGLAALWWGDSRYQGRAAPSAAAGTINQSFGQKSEFKSITGEVLGHFRPFPSSFWGQSYPVSRAVLQEVFLSANTWLGPGSWSLSHGWGQDLAALPQTCAFSFCLPSLWIWGLRWVGLKDAPQHLRCLGGGSGRLGVGRMAAVLYLGIWRGVRVGLFYSIQLYLPEKLYLWRKGNSFQPPKFFSVS